MKMTIDLNSTDIETLVRQQIAAEVSKITTEYIEREIAKIIAIKSERISDKDLNGAIVAAIENRTWKAFGDAYALDRKIHQALSDAARSLLKEKLSS